MHFNRQNVKASVRMQLKQEPSLKNAALMYILLTTLLTNLAETVADAFTGGGELSASMYSLYEQYAATMDASLIQQIQSETVRYYLSTAGMIALAVKIFFTLYTEVMDAGFTSTAMHYMRGEHPISRTHLTDGLELATKIVLICILQFALILCWSFLFILPGIMAAYSYRMSFMILLDDPDISPIEALRRSRRMMRGKRMDLFALDISFIGWIAAEYILSTVGSEVGYMLTSSFGNTLIEGIVEVILSVAVRLPLDMWLNAYFRGSEVCFYEACRSELPQEPPERAQM